MTLVMTQYPIFLLSCFLTLGLLVTVFFTRKKDTLLSLLLTLLTALSVSLLILMGLYYALPLVELFLVLLILLLFSLLLLGKGGTP